MGKHQTLCRLKRTAPGVQLRELHDRKTGTNRLAFGGLATCKSPLCPLCVPALVRARCEDIKQAIDVWGAGRTYFLTLTTRHHKGMALELLHRLQTTAFGMLFAGRAGQELSRDLGGPTVRTAPPAGSPHGEHGAARAAKPHTIRAHDRTWSDRHGWHPHMHALVFLHVALPEERLRELLLPRWKVCVVKALASLKKTVQRAENEPETAQLRERCEKVFGKKLFRPERSLAASAAPIAEALARFCRDSIMPNDERAIVVELVRQPGRVAQYLTKLGCELSGMGNKIGNVVREPNGAIVEHFGLWQLATIACTHGHVVRQRARAAWSDLYRATFGTQTLTFSQGARKAFGLDERLDADVEQEVAEVTEDERALGSIEGVDWDAMAKSQRQGLLATLHNAHRLGVLELLPYVRKAPLPETAFMGRAVVREPERRPDFTELEARGLERGRAPPPVPPPRHDHDDPQWRDLERWERDDAREQLRYRLHVEGIDPPRKASNT